MIRAFLNFSGEYFALMISLQNYVIFLIAAKYMKQKMY